MNIKKIQKNFYDERGFIKITNFFSKTELSELIKLAEDVESQKPVKGKSMMYFDKIKNKLSLTRTENFFPLKFLNNVFWNSCLVVTKQSFFMLFFYNF